MVTLLEEFVLDEFDKLVFCSVRGEVYDDDVDVRLLLLTAELVLVLDGVVLEELTRLELLVDVRLGVTADDDERV